jgi:hypothetical protein
MDVITCFYYTSNKDRQTEIETSLWNNMSKEFINKIHLIMTDKDHQTFLNSKFIGHPFYSKIVVKVSTSQPKYSYLVRYASQLNDSTVCICNSDIEFLIDNDNIPLLDNLRNKKICYFITRHEHDMSDFLIKNFGGSHDAFIFNAKVLKESIKDKELDFIDYIQNTSGIESLLTLFFIETLKYEVYNPCWQLVIKHHHKSNVRLWLVTSSGPIG